MIIKKLLIGILLWGVNCQIFATEVFVIAHSISTRAEARKVIQKKGWIETTNSEQATGILVVCRSGLSYPLNFSYKNIKELNEDANMQLNITGSNYHIYIFRMSGNRTVTEDQHIYYPTDD